VDDEELVLDLIVAVLEKAGYRVLRAADARQAMALCQSQTGPIHLALLDVVMPGMNGPELRECLRELLPSVRVLYMSGYTHTQISERGIDAGPGEFIAKPFSPAALLSRVREELAAALPRQG